MQQDIRADIAASGPSFQRMLAIDATIRSPTTDTEIAHLITRMQARTITATLGEAIAENALYSGEQDKKRHYHNVCKNAMRAALQSQEDNFTSLLSQDDSLGCLGLEMVPAVATPFGNLSHQFDYLLQRLAKQATSIECSNRPSPPPEAIFRSLCRRTLQRYRADISCTILKIMAASFPFASHLDRSEMFTTHTTNATHTHAPPPHVRQTHTHSHSHNLRPHRASLSAHLTDEDDNVTGVASSHQEEVHT
jgi:hypothetical protein